MMNTKSDFSAWASQLTSQEIEQMPFILGRKNLDHHFIDGSTILCHLKGVKNIDTLQGKRAGDLPCPSAQFAEHYEQADKECIEKKSETTQLSMHNSTDGKKIALLVKRYPLYDVNDIVCGSLFMSNDITSLPMMTIAQWFKSHDESIIGKHVADCARAFSILRDNTFLNYSQRETEVLFYLVRGFSNSQIANLLNIQKSTVIYYIDNIKTKSGCHDKQQVIEHALEMGFINVIPASLIYRSRQN